MWMMPPGEMRMKGLWPVGVVPSTVWVRHWDPSQREYRSSPAAPATKATLSASPLSNTAETSLPV
jgi:hypothetical protein